LRHLVIWKDASSGFFHPTPTRTTNQPRAEGMASSYGQVSASRLEASIVIPILGSVGFRFLISGNFASCTPTTSLLSLAFVAGFTPSCADRPSRSLTCGCDLGIHFFGLLFISRLGCISYKGVISTPKSFASFPLPFPFFLLFC
jgi:hypothetical protein